MAHSTKRHRIKPPWCFGSLGVGSVGTTTHRLTNAKRGTIMQLTHQSHVARDKAKRAFQPWANYSKSSADVTVP